MVLMVHLSLVKGKLVTVIYPDALLAQVVAVVALPFLEVKVKFRLIFELREKG